MSGSGIIDERKTNFENAGVSVTVYDKVESNPKDYNVMDAYEAYSDDELQKMAEHMMGDLCTPGNPRDLTLEAAREVLRDCMYDPMHPNTTNGHRQTIQEVDPELGPRTAGYEARGSETGVGIGRRYDQTGRKDFCQKEPTGENPHEAMYEMHRIVHKHTHQSGAS